MKKLFAFSLMFLLCACVEGSIYKQYDQDCDDHLYAPKNCSVKKETRKVVREEPVVKEKVYVYEERAEQRPQSRSHIRMVAQDPYVAVRHPAPRPAPRPAPVPVTVVEVEAPAPAPVPVVVPAATATIVSGDACNGCEPIVRQTREPVEVIYKKTTYTTVFEPKTTSTVTYEKEPVINQKVVSHTEVVPATEVKTVVTRPAVKKVKTVVTRPAVKKVKTVVATRPVVKKVSYMIENTETTAPSELLIEDIK